MSVKPRNHASRGPMTAEQGANITRKLDRLLVLARQGARRDAAVMKALGVTNGKRKAKAV